jgi:hypothetical protein
LIRESRSLLSLVGEVTERYAGEAFPLKRVTEEKIEWLDASLH